MGGMWDGHVAVGVEADGLQWMFGPFDGMPDAMGFVSAHVWDTDRYRHHYGALIDPAEAADRLNSRIGEPDGEPGLFGVPPRDRREPLEVALREAIARQHGAAGEGPYGDGLFAHLDIHRPWRVTTKPQECWDGDCEHDRDPEGGCAAAPRLELWCRGCTPVYIGGGEYDGTTYTECQVDWPCSPVLAMCASFEVPLTGKALPTQR